MSANWGIERQYVNGPDYGIPQWTYRGYRIDYDPSSSDASGLIELRSSCDLFSYLAFNRRDWGERCVQLDNEAT